jgi:hypothetical protein
MVQVNISDNEGVLLSIELQSIVQFNRNEEIITELLHQYIFEFRIENTLNEIKQKVQIILDADIHNQRKQKLIKINGISQK